jgi:hypothetical protein
MRAIVIAASASLCVACAGRDPQPMATVQPTDANATCAMMSPSRARGGGGATAGGWSKMSDEPLAREREPIERARARLEALVVANAAPRCGAFTFDTSALSDDCAQPCR